MCGICIILKINLTDKSIELLKSIENSQRKESSLTKEESTINITEPSNYLEELYKKMKSRGPDYTSFLEYTFNDSGLNTFSYKLDENSPNINICNIEENIIYCISSVLSLRGNSITRQPIINEKGDFLCYNGEIYSTSNKNISKDVNINDGEYLFSELTQIFSDEKSKSNENSGNALLNMLTNIDSDHSLVYYNNQIKSLYINKDLFGKRSLILLYIIKNKGEVNKNNENKIENTLIISSCFSENIIKLIKNKENECICLEIEANCVYILNLKEKYIEKHMNNKLKVPSSLRFPFPSSDNINQEIIKCNILARDMIINELKESIQKRIDNYKGNSVAVLFSGGVDSLLLSYIICKLYPKKQVDLITLSFGKTAPDRQSAFISFYEMFLLLLALNKEESENKLNINLILVDKDLNDIKSNENKIKELMFPQTSHMDFNISSALNMSTRLSGKKINIKTFLSIMKKYFEENVENQSIIKENKEEVMNEIKSQMMKIENKQPLKVRKHDFSNNIISKKLPSLMEFIDKLNIEQILYDDLEYKSLSRIVFSGLGADEFFGGYARYRTSNNHKTTDQYSVSTEEMIKDIDRIWIRNFGRDDRVCSDNSIELRFPFFDHNLISLLSKIDMSLICDFTLERGFGEKKILREILSFFGFKYGAMFEKRAIQFGSLLAKETNKDKYGSNRKANGKAQFV